MDKTDQELVTETLSGDTEAFGLILNRYQDPIYRYCFRLLNFHPHDSEDATSETFLKAYKSLASYNTNLKFSSWLYRIAHNTAVNLIRDKSKLFYIDIENFWHIPDSKTEETNFTKADLEKVLSQLNPMDKSLIILFHLEEKSLKEIGQIFKLTENTVAVKLKRARLKAKKFIK